MASPFSVRPGDDEREALDALAARENITPNSIVRLGIRLMTGLPIPAEFADLIPPAKVAA